MQGGHPVTIKLRSHRAQRQYKLQHGRCWLCDEAMTLEESTWDHVIPKSCGGLRGENLKLAHARCNRIRGAVFESVAPLYVRLYLHCEALRLLPSKRTGTYLRMGLRRAALQPGQPGYWYDNYIRQRDHE